MNAPCMVNSGQFTGNSLWKIGRMIQQVWSRMISAPILRGYSRTTSLVQAQARPHVQTVLSAPRKVEICGLTKSEAEELLDWLENARGTYIFAECALDAKGFNVSFLTKCWHPGMSNEGKPDAQGTASKESALGRVPKTVFKIKASGRPDFNKETARQPEMSGATSD